MKDVKSITIRLAIAAFVISLLSNATQSLIVYIGGNALTDQPGGVLVFSLGTFIVGTLFSTMIHFIFFCIATFMGLLLFVLLTKQRDKSDTPTPTACKNTAIEKFLKMFAIVVFAIAVLLSAYHALSVYTVLTTVSNAAWLIVLATVLAFLTTLIYSVAAVGFIGGIVCFLVAILFAFICGLSKSAGE